MPLAKAVTLPELTGGSHIAPIAIIGVPNSAGSGACNSVTVPVSLPVMPPFFDGRYAVSVSCSQACFAAITAKTASSFNVVMTPTTSSVTLAAGSIDVTVIP